MDWFETGFDPLKSLEQLHQNQVALNNNQMAMLRKIEEQDKLIDTLLKSVELSNKANEILLDSFSQQIKQALEKINDQT